MVRLAERFVVVGVDVGRIVVARLNHFVELVHAGARVVGEQRPVGVFAVVHCGTAARIAVLVEAVGEVTRDAQRLERRDDQACRVREVVRAVDVAVRALVEQDVASVGDLVIEIRRAVKPRSVGVLHGEVGQCVAGAVSDGVVYAAVSQRLVIRREERRVVRERCPPVDPKIEFRTQVVLVIHVGMCALNTFLAVIGARDEVFDVLRAAAERDVVLLHGPTLLEEHVPPVVVAVVDPLFAAVADLFDDPRTVGMLGPVVHARQQLLHVVIVVFDIVRSGVGLPELVDRIDRPVTAVLVVGRGRGLLPAETAAVTYRRLAVLGRAVLGGDQDDAEGCAGAVDGCRRSVLDDRDRLHVVGVDAVQVAHHAVDQHERVGRVDRVDAADVDRRRAAGFTRGGGDVETRYGTLQHAAQRMGDAVFELLAPYGRNGAGQVDFFLRTVADYDGCIEHDGVLLQVDRDAVPA